MANELSYQSGFANHFCSEALPGALPVGQNSPQRAPYGLYAEQLSGTSFLAPRHENLRTWTYRILPSAVHGAFAKLESDLLPPVAATPFSPEQMRWSAPRIPSEPTDFLDGLIPWAINGDLRAHRGCAVYLYAANRAMDFRYFYSADGDFLVVPQSGGLRLNTELGALEISPGEIAVIPRGIKFQVALKEATARGYVCENYGAAFRLPSLGAIGANGLANPRDFQAPVARFEERKGDLQLVAKFEGALWTAAIDHSPLDVVAWHGNYVPYKYDLARFNVINTVSFDHPDPSIYTVLTSPSEFPGVANLDFVIFPPRWSVAEHTFRPPYFHRNVMSEYMGLITGKYEAKGEAFEPGGGSLHNRMTGHGPDAESFQSAAHAELKPTYLGSSLAFMFESAWVFHPTAHALASPQRQKNYAHCWQGLKSRFDPGKR